MADECVTAVLVAGTSTAAALETALAELASSVSVKRLPPDPNICDVMRLVRVPALCVYNAAGEETARAYGNKHIPELIENVLA